MENDGMEKENNNLKFVREYLMEKEYNKLKFNKFYSKKLNINITQAYFKSGIKLIYFHNLFQI